MSAMGVALRSVVEDSAERLARQETAARQDRAKLQKELDRHIKRANDAEKKSADALRFRDVAEEKTAAAEKRLAKVEDKLTQSLEATKAAERELARLVEERAEEMAQARHQIEVEYAQNKVKPVLQGMRQRSWRDGYGEGFRVAISTVMAEHPELPEDVATLDVAFEGDEVLITGGVEIVSGGGAPLAVTLGDENAQAPATQEMALTEELASATAEGMDEDAGPKPAAEGVDEDAGPKPADGGEKEPVDLAAITEGTVEEEGNGNSEGVL